MVLDVHPHKPVDWQNSEVMEFLKNAARSMSVYVRKGDVTYEVSPNGILRRELDTREPDVVAGITKPEDVTDA